MHAARRATERLSALAARVGEALAAEQALEPAEPVLCLVSGGADSLCLWGVLRELGHPAEALHVEHGLRGAAGRADAEFCAGLGARVVTLAVGDGRNLEARAREARYAAARDAAGGRPIAVGHTASDQAETLVYRLASSSGPRALAGMRMRRGDVVRPLLCATRTETRAWCAEHGLLPRHDETNDDRDRPRNLIRHEILPLLARAHPGAEGNIARTAALLAELDDLLRDLAGDLVEDELDLDRLAALPPALRALVLREAAERAAGRPLRLPRALTDRLVAVAARRAGEERLSLARDLEAVRRRGRLRFAPPARYPRRP